MVVPLSEYPVLHYFMQGYWNQMGDEVHGTLRGAVRDFCSAESADYRRRLFEDLSRADEAGVIPDDIDWDDPGLSGFWEDVMLTQADLAQALETLANAEVRQ